MRLGLAGLLDLGFVAFYAVGAYTVALLTSTADLGIAGGKGQGFLIVKGEVRDKIDEKDFVPRLIEEAKVLIAAGEIGTGDD